MKELSVNTVFIEMASSKNADRPELKKMLAFARAGDILFIESISRLTRSVRDLQNIVDLLNSKRVALVSLNENFDTATPQGKFILTVFAPMSELECESTMQRQSEGIAAAKITGKRFGRPSFTVPDNFRDVISEWMNGQINAVQAMKKLDMKRTMFYKAANMLQKR